MKYPRLCHLTIAGIFTLAMVSCDANKAKDVSLSEPLVNVQTAKTSANSAESSPSSSTTTQMAPVNQNDMQNARDSFTNMLQEQAKASGQKFNPAMIKSISATPVPDWYEVYIGGKDVIYLHKDGQHMMQGELVNYKTQKNITQASVEELSKINFKDLPLSQAVTWTNGTKPNPKYEIAVFADPNCGYCKRFEQSIQNIDGLTIHTFIIPILSEDSQTKAIDILCAKDPVQAWRNDMLFSQSPAKSTDKTCHEKAEKMLVKNRQLAEKYGVNSTPHVFLPSGRNMPGAIPAEQLMSMLKQ